MCIYFYILYIYIYKFFSTTEGEFKPQYNNHKNSLTYHRIDEKATEISNTFGT